MSCVSSCLSFLNPDVACSGGAIDRLLERLLPLLELRGAGYYDNSGRKTRDNLVQYIRLAMFTLSRLRDDMAENQVLPWYTDR
jgi:hypothetical protein